MEQFQIGCLLKMITDKIKMRADADLAQQGLTLTQSRVLGYLDRSGGQARCRGRAGYARHDPDNGAADAALADAGTDRGAGIGAAHDLCRSRLTGP